MLIPRDKDGYPIGLVPPIDLRVEFKKLQLLADEESHCRRRRIAAMIITRYNARFTGVNGMGALSGLCEKSCLRDELGLLSGIASTMCRCSHAECAAILNTPRDHLRDATMLITTAPCISCAALIAAVGINRVIYWSEYSSGMGLDLLRLRGVSVTNFKE